MRPERTISNARALRCKGWIGITKSGPDSGFSQFTTEFTKTVCDNLHVERILNLPPVVLLKIEGKCAGFRAICAHISGHLPASSSIQYCKDAIERIKYKQGKCLDWSITARRIVIIAKIITDGRTDLKDFFEKSGNFSGVKLTHTPFLVFHEEDDAIRVHIVDSAEKLLKFSDETPVMGQWQGNFHSDFFQFTVGDYRPCADAKRIQREKSLLTARNVVKKLGPKGGLRSLSYEYKAEEGYTVHTGTSSPAEARELEAFFNQHSIPITVHCEER